MVVLVVKNLSANARDVRDESLIPGLGKSPGGEHGNPLQYSFLENPMDRGAGQATVHGVTESQTRLSTHKYVQFSRSVSRLCNPMDFSPPGSSVHGILQERILEWVAISFSRGSSQNI